MTTSEGAVPSMMWWIGLFFWMVVTVVVFLRVCRARDFRGPFLAPLLATLAVSVCLYILVMRVSLPWS